MSIAKKYSLSSCSRGKSEHRNVRAARQKALREELSRNNIFLAFTGGQKVSIVKTGKKKSGAIVYAGRFSRKEPR